MARKQISEAESGTVLATALSTIHYVVGTQVFVGAPGDIIEVPADEAQGLVERGLIALPIEAEPTPEPDHDPKTET